MLYLFFYLTLEKLIKKKKTAILSHYNQETDIQDVAEFIGNSLTLAQHTDEIDTDIIFFYGIHFISETNAGT